MRGAGDDEGELALSEPRALRFGAVGALKFERPWIYTLFVASSAFDRGYSSQDESGLIMYDYRLDVPLGSEATMSVGKQKEPISMDWLMMLTYNPMQERAAVVGALMPARNVGVVFNGTGFDQRMTWAGGAFNDWFDTNQTFDESSSQMVGRLTWAPYASTRNANLVHLGAGVRYSDAQEGVRYRTEPEVFSAPDFVDTGSFDAENTLTYDLELSWLRDRFWFTGELFATDVKSESADDPTFKGYYLSGSWVIKGDPRPYLARSGLFGPVPITRPVNAGGWGALEAATRWSQLDLDDGLVNGGRMDIFSLGLTWWLSAGLNASVNWRHVWLDRDGETGQSDALVVRLVMMLV